MLKFIIDNKLIVILVHIFFGYAATFGFFPLPFAYLVLAMSVVVAIFSGNKYEECTHLAAYLVGLEVFLRMTRGAPLFETGKYSVIVILAIGAFVGPTRNKLTLSFVFYLLLLMLGIVFTQVPEGESLRRSIAFNLSGPFMLGICALYFYKRRMDVDTLYDSMYMAVLPIFSMITFMYFRTPDLSEIAFGGVSLGETSGGFGPNQVATIIGFGIFIIGFFIISKKQFTGFVLLDALFLAYFIYRGLLTFSRGGVLTGAIAFGVFALLFVRTQRNIAKLFQYVFIGGIFILGIWVYTSNVTGGMLDNRYTGRNASGIKKKDATAGRLDIITTQLESFRDAPIFGIGVGNGKYVRRTKVNKAIASHNELTRLIEEHGLIGLVILVLLFVVPLVHIFKSNSFHQAVLIPFLLFWFLTINHSAMRIAFPGFIYGLSMITFTRSNE